MRICLLGLFDTDPIITGGTGGAAKKPASSEPCVSPGNGMPAYDRAVLGTLHGEGAISRADYQAVRAGSLSIEDLNLTPDQLERLRCTETPKPSGSDRHVDPSFPPQISGVASGQSVAFSAQHKPTDKAHRLAVTMDGAVSLAPRARVCRVTFGAEYVQERRVPVLPIVTVSAVGGTETWRVGNITSSGYDLYSDSGVKAGTTAEVQVLVEPTRR